MTDITLSINFRGEDGEIRSVAHSVESPYPSDIEGEQRLSDNLLAELKVDVLEQGPPRHYATARGWLNFPRYSTTLDKYFDVTNSQAMWLELSNLVIGAEADLNVAQSFKSLEPTTTPDFGDDRAINNLHYIHDRKMLLLDHAVHDLIKVQDLVNRLLHESMGGNLVDTSDPDWEKDELNRKNVLAGLKRKLAEGTLSKVHLDAIQMALEIPRNHPGSQIALSYRNRLAHHIRPSVDYSMFFSNLASREGEELKNAEGKVLGRQHKIYAQPPVQYQFDDLYAAFTEYLAAVVGMLQKFSEIAILRHFGVAVIAKGATE